MADTAKRDPVRPLRVPIIPKARRHPLWVVVVIVVCALGIATRVAVQALQTRNTTRSFQGMNDFRPAPPTNLRVSVDGVPQPEPFKIFVTVPNSLRIDQTQEVRVKLTNPTAVLTQAGLAVPTVDSPAFDIGGPNVLSNDPNVTEWQWLLTPKRTGSHKISLEIPENYPDLQAPAPGGSKAGTQKEYVFDVQVVNELGLSARESALLLAVASILTVAATILGFPFIKKRFAPARGREP